MNLISELKRIDKNNQDKPIKWDMAGASFIERDKKIFAHLKGVAFKVIFTSKKQYLKDDKIQTLRKNLENRDLGNYAIDCLDGSYLILAGRGLQFGLTAPDYHPFESQGKLVHCIDNS